MNQAYLGLSEVRNPQNQQKTQYIPSQGPQNTSPVFQPPTFQVPFPQQRNQNINQGSEIEKLLREIQQLNQQENQNQQDILHFQEKNQELIHQNQILDRKIRQGENIPLNATQMQEDSKVQYLQQKIDHLQSRISNIHNTQINISQLPSEKHLVSQIQSLNQQKQCLIENIQQIMNKKQDFERFKTQEVARMEEWKQNLHLRQVQNQQLINHLQTSISQLEKKQVFPYEDKDQVDYSEYHRVPIASILGENFQKKNQVSENRFKKLDLD